MSASEQEEPSGEDGGGDDDTPEWMNGPILPSSREIHEQYKFFMDVKEAYNVHDDLVGSMLATQVQMSRVERSQASIIEELRSVVAELRYQRGPPIVGAFPIEMSHDVAADTPTSNPNTVTRVPSEETEVRIDGVSLAWPDGAANSVGIQLRTGNGLKLVPRNPEDDYLAFNDFADTFDLRYTLEPGEELVAQTVNLDTSNPHFVNIVPHIEELASGADPIPVPGTGSGEKEGREGGDN